MGQIKHSIAEDGVYNIELNGEIILSIKLDKELNQIVAETKNEVYAGPVDLIRFSTDV